MNVTHLQHFVVEQFREIQPSVSAIFSSAKRRAETGKRINIQPFVSQLRTILKPHRIAVMVDPQKETRIARTSMQWYPPLGGVCYEATLPKVARIQVIVGIHQSSNRLELNMDGWNLFEFRFLGVISHELVHRAQFAAGRKGASLIFRPHLHAQMDKYQLLEQQYLGSIDEVEAYAHDCVEEWLYLLPTQKLTMRGLKHEFLGERRLPSLTYYADVFHRDSKHPAIQRLFRKILAWYEIKHVTDEAAAFAK
jgi:hypothetical protein